MPRLLGRDADVAHDGEVEAARERWTVDSRENGSGKSRHVRW